MDAEKAARYRRAARILDSIAELHSDDSPKQNRALYGLAISDYRDCPRELDEARRAIKALIEGESESAVKEQARKTLRIICISRPEVREPERQRMSNLALSFPSLREAPGVREWDPNALNIWATGSATSIGRVSASFILNVWEPSTAWEAGPFELMRALRTWDSEHRAAFASWSAQPWWP